MAFIKLSHATESTAPDFFVNINHITRIMPRDSGATILFQDGTSVAVQQTPDTIADYVDQLETSRSTPKINLSRE